MTPTLEALLLLSPAWVLPMSASPLESSSSRRPAPIVAPPLASASIVAACRALGLVPDEVALDLLDAAILERVPGVILARCTEAQWVPLVAVTAARLGWCTAASAQAVVDGGPAEACGATGAVRVRVGADEGWMDDDSRGRISMGHRRRLTGRGR